MNKMVQGEANVGNRPVRVIAFESGSIKLAEGKLCHPERSVLFDIGNVIINKRDFKRV
jgi:hypothetical protein